MDIADRSENMKIELNFNITSNLVAALSESSEYVSPLAELTDFYCRWSQVYILESLMNFTPQNRGDAELVAERIAPRLQHANSSVVLTTIKVILYLTNYMSKDEDIASLCKKLSPPLGRTAYERANSSSNIAFKTTRTAVRSTTKCPADPGKTTRNTEKRHQSFLLQIQRSYLRQVG